MAVVRHSGHDPALPCRPAGNGLCEPLEYKPLLGDEHSITEAEFEAAKAYLTERYGKIPPSLQRVIDRGGRFRRGDVR